MRNLSLEDTVAKYDGLIRTICCDLWLRARATVFGWEDLAQDVSLAILTGRRKVSAKHAAADIREEAIDAIRRYTEAPLIIPVSDNPAIEELLYSSAGNGDRNGD